MSKLLMHLNPVPGGQLIIPSDKKSFTGRTVEVDEELLKALTKRVREFEVLQGWLQYCHQRLNNPRFEFEVPEEVKEILCLDQPSEEPPKKKATGRRSNKKSPSKQTKTKSNTTTNRKSTPSSGSRSRKSTSPTSSSETESSSKPKDD